MSFTLLEIALKIDFTKNLYSRNDHFPHCETCTLNVMKMEECKKLTTRVLRPSTSPLLKGLLHSNMKVLGLEQTSLGARETFSVKQLCKEMPSASIGAFFFSSSSGYFQK